MSYLRKGSPPLGRAYGGALLMTKNNPHDCKSDGHRIKWNITFGKCLECGKIFENEYNAGLELSDLA